MSAFTAASQATVDATFDVFGTPDCIYRPPPGDTGGATGITVILRQADETIEFGSTRAVAKGQVAEVRASEVAAPKRGGVFVVGDESLEILSQPRCDDPERLVFICTVGAKS